MLEKRFASVPPQAFTANGTDRGVITVADTRLFKVKQEVILMASALPNLDTIEVKKVISPTQLMVGPRNPDIRAYTDVSLYTTAALSFIFSNEQKRPSIPMEEFWRAVYEEEPTVALRTMLVDKYGNDYRTENPLPVQLTDGSINIGTVNAELEVQLSHLDDDPNSGDVHDSVRIGDGKDELAVNDDGSINIVAVLGPGASGESFYNEVTSVANSVLTNILTYTVPPATTGKLNTVDVSGTNIAEYQIWVNEGIVDKKRTYWSGPMNEIFNFNGSISLVSGDVVRVRVIHIRPFVGDFNARLTVIEQV